MQEFKKMFIHNLGGHYNCSSSREKLYMVIFCRLLLFCIQKHFLIWDLKRFSGNIIFQGGIQSILKQEMFIINSLKIYSTHNLETLSEKPM